jgi:B9 domain-containing protein 2
MAEVFFIGRLVGASGFRSKDLSARFQFHSGPAWRLVEGDALGQTQFGQPRDDSDLSVWSHPLDVHYVTQSALDWPRIVLEIWHRDSRNRRYLSGYGRCALPCAPGLHFIEVSCWRPAGTFTERLNELFTGTAVALRSTSVVDAPEERYKLDTIPAGTVHVEITVLPRGLSEHGVSAS